MLHSEGVRSGKTRAKRVSNGTHVALSNLECSSGASILPRRHGGTEKTGQREKTADSRGFAQIRLWEITSMVHEVVWVAQAQHDVALTILFTILGLGIGNREFRGIQVVLQEIGRMRSVWILVCRNSAATWQSAL